MVIKTGTQFLVLWWAFNGLEYFCKNPDMKHNHRRKKLSLGADNKMDAPGVKGMGIG